MKQRQFWTIDVFITLGICLASAVIVDAILNHNKTPTREARGIEWLKWAIKVWIMMSLSLVTMTLLWEGLVIFPFLQDYTPVGKSFPCHELPQRMDWTHFRKERRKNIQRVKG